MIRSNQCNARFSILRILPMAILGNLLYASAALAVPIVGNISCVFYNGDLTVSGHVVDAAEDPAGSTVYIGGDAHGNTEVDANGDFEITIDIAAPYGSVAFMSQSNGGVFSDVVWEEYGDP